MNAKAVGTRPTTTWTMSYHREVSMPEGDWVDLDRRLQEVPESEMHQPITVKELLPIVLAPAVGKSWAGLHVHQGAPGGGTGSPSEPSGHSAKILQLLGFNLPDWTSSPWRTG